MPKAKKLVLPYDGDPYKSGTMKKTRRGMRSEEALERKRKRATAHREAKEAALQRRKDRELLASDVVDVPPKVDEPQAQVMVAEDALVGEIAGCRAQKTSRERRSEERKRERAIAHRETKDATLQLEQVEDEELLDPQVIDIVA